MNSVRRAAPFVNCISPSEHRMVMAREVEKATKLPPVLADVITQLAPIAWAPPEMQRSTKTDTLGYARRFLMTPEQLRPPIFAEGFHTTDEQRQYRCFYPIEVLSCSREYGTVTVKVRLENPDVRAALREEDSMGARELTFLANKLQLHFSEPPFNGARAYAYDRILGLDPLGIVRRQGLSDQFSDQSDSCCSTM